jgi:hypothetical protein
MAEVASFGDIVNSLLTLRQNYHEQLKSIPQYDAYLLVESSTEKAAGALHASADSPASIAAEVIDSLQFARSRFEQHLGNAPEYRTLLAIDKLIQEVSIDLGVAKPAQVDAPEPPHDAIVAAEPEHGRVASDAFEAEPIAAAAEAAPDVTETTAPPPADMPVQPPRVMSIDLDEAHAHEDIVPVHAARGESSIEGGEDEDLLEIVYRDVAKAAEAADAAAEPAPAMPPQPKMFEEDTGEAAA